ncbi:MAG: methylenetetrahydrofolate reductase, partial [Planctomycetes bacterium]|nr:methylenetetrahydrofolate reductase [Planctomycetota bacterium]
TYGAGGSTRGRTTDIVCGIQEQYAIPTMAHLTCVNSSQNDIQELLDDFYQRGIRNILGLRGDPPEGSDTFVAQDDGYAYANELISAIHTDGRFDIVCAAYPDGHPEALNRQADWDIFVKKIQAGAMMGITQCFFDVQAWVDMNNYVKSIEPNASIYPGILPLTDYHQVVRFCDRCGAFIPEAMKKRLEPYADDKEAIAQAGMEFTFELCNDLLAAGAPGLHIYTLNKSTQATRVFENFQQFVH